MLSYTNYRNTSDYYTNKSYIGVCIYIYIYTHTHTPGVPKDEPTNHMDSSAKSWLASYLANDLPKSAIIVVVVVVVINMISTNE